MKRFVIACAVTLFVAASASAACSEHGTKEAQAQAAAEKSAPGCPAGCCDQEKPCPMAAPGAEMPADCPCKKAQKTAEDDATK